MASAASRAPCAREENGKLTGTLAESDKLALAPWVVPTAETCPAYPSRKSSASSRETWRSQRSCNERESRSVSSPRTFVKGDGVVLSVVEAEAEEDVIALGERSGTPVDRATPATDMLPARARAGSAG